MWARWSSPFTVLRGSNRPGVWPGMIYVAWVIHLGPKRGSGMPGAACPAAEAALRGVARQRARVRAILGSGLGRWGSACERKATARLGRARAALQWPRYGAVAVRAAAERHRAAFWALG